MIKVIKRNKTKAHKALEAMNIIADVGLNQNINVTHPITETRRNVSIQSKSQSNSVVNNNQRRIYKPKNN